MSDEDWVASPCIRLCQLGDDGACIGCGRTPQDVLEWFDASPDRKRAIKLAANERMERRYADYLAQRGGAVS
jgi:predicted Fe-S protein YdhL (DUF1289 family)